MGTNSLVGLVRFRNPIMVNIWANRCGVVFLETGPHFHIAALYFFGWRNLLFVVLVVKELEFNFLHPYFFLRLIRLIICGSRIVQQEPLSC